MFSAVSSHSTLLRSCFKGIITFVFTVPSVLTGPKQMTLKSKLLGEKKICICQFGTTFCQLTSKRASVEAVAVIGIATTVQVAVAYCMLHRHRKEYSALTVASLKDSYPNLLFHIAVFNAALYTSTLLPSICSHCPLQNSGLCEFLQIPFNTPNQYLLWFNFVCFLSIFCATFSL